MTETGLNAGAASARERHPLFPARSAVSRAAEQVLWLAGIALLGWCLYVTLDARVYQSAQVRALDASKTAPRTSPVPPSSPVAPVAPGVPYAAGRPSSGAADPLLVGKLEIPRLGLSAAVREGTDAKTLRRAVGHIPGTALPGEPGNVGLAGHRDTFFRPLRSIRIGDAIQLVTVTGTFSYRVVATRVVGPGDTRVLSSDGVSALTLVTCWPFGYVGNAPDRFIVRATRVPAG